MGCYWEIGELFLWLKKRGGCLYRRVGLVCLGTWVEGERKAINCVREG